MTGSLLDITLIVLVLMSAAVFAFFLDIKRKHRNFRNSSVRWRNRMVEESVQAGFRGGSMQRPEEVRCGSKT